MYRFLKYAFFLKTLKYNKVLKWKVYDFYSYNLKHFAVSHKQNTNLSLHVSFFRKQSKTCSFQSITTCRSLFFISYKMSKKVRFSSKPICMRLVQIPFDWHMRYKTLLNTQYKHAGQIKPFFVHGILQTTICWKMLKTH